MHLLDARRLLRRDDEREADAARREGENPDVIERENLRQRHEEARDGARARAEGRLLIISVFFLCAFFLVALKMSALAASEPAEGPAY